MALFQDLNEQGKTVMIVTHEFDIAHHCKRIIQFKDGRIVSDEQVPNPISAHEALKALPTVDVVEPAAPPAPYTREQQLS